MPVFVVLGLQGSCMLKHHISRMANHNRLTFLLKSFIDAAAAADSIGIRRERAVNYRPTSAGTAISYEAMNDAICTVRCKESLDNGNWRKNLDNENK